MGTMCAWRLMDSITPFAKLFTSFEFDKSCREEVYRPACQNEAGFTRIWTEKRPINNYKNARKSTSNEAKNCS